MAASPQPADYYRFRGELWRVIASERRQAGPGAPARGFVRLQSMSGELADHARGGLRAHRCPEPLWSCTRCGPVCGTFWGRQDGYAHGGWRPCNDVGCIVQRGGTHEHWSCPCMPDPPSMGGPQGHCDLYVASRPDCPGCPSTWSWPPVDPADIFVGEPPPNRPHIAEREDGIYVVSGTVSGEAIRLTDEQLGELRAMLSRTLASSLPCR